MDGVSMDERQLMEILTDPETSLLRKEYFLLRFEEEFKKSWRYGWPLALLLVELEGLEAIARDEGPRAAASAQLDVTGELLSASRDTDLSARLAPGLFAILLPGADRGGTRAFVERVVRGGIADGSFGRLSVRVGGGLAPCDRLATADALRELAEDALAQARESGESCVLR